MRPLFVTLSLICVLVPCQFCVLNENVLHIVEQLKEMMDRWSVNGQKERLLEFTYLRKKISATVIKVDFRYRINCLLL